MRRLVFALFVFVPMIASAQTIGEWTFGPSVPVYTLQSTDGDLTSSFLSAGAGFSVRRHLLHSADGSIALISFETPLYVSATDESFRFEIGGLVSFFNGLFGFGASILGADTGTDRTFKDGEVRGLLVFGFNIMGSGIPEGAAKTVQSPDAPFNCVRW